MAQSKENPILDEPELRASELPMFDPYDKDTVGFGRIDYSAIYETNLTPINKEEFKDCTQDLIEGKLELDSLFFNTIIYWEGKTYEYPQNGVRGDDFRRIEVFFYPGATKTDSLTYSLKGRTKIDDNICDIKGTVRIKKIYHCNEWYADSMDLFMIIADYSFKEDAKKKGSGEYRGIFGATGYISDDAPGIVQVNDLNDVADGYWNRNYVGTWRSYENPELLLRCIWGDYRLPYTFDFDVGDGEMFVNSKYNSPAWERWFSGEEQEIIHWGNDKIIWKYKDAWW